MPLYLTHNGAVESTHTSMARYVSAEFGRDPVTHLLPPFTRCGAEAVSNLQLYDAVADTRADAAASMRSRAVDVLQGSPLVALCGMTTSPGDRWQIITNPTDITTLHAECRQAAIDEGMRKEGMRKHPRDPEADRYEPIAPDPEPARTESPDVG
jgi:hypothetical protein